MMIDRRGAVVVLATMLAGCGGRDAEADSAPGSDITVEVAAGEVPVKCPGDNGGLQLPEGFCATVFADSVGGARHLTVAANGDVFVQLMGTRRGGGSASGTTGILALRDTDHDGRADTTARFGRPGGTGIGLHGGFLYADDQTRIVRYPLIPGALTPSGAAQAIVIGLPTGGHGARNFTFDSAGALYVNVGSRTNSCQEADRKKESPGRDPCQELQTRAGIWKFDANNQGQRQSDGEHFATGIRNAMGLAISPIDGKLYATQHGRDQLLQNWPQHFNAKQSAENPAEELVQANAGDDFGWPYCYYSTDQKHLVLAPEYGGDGKKVERCANKKEPAVTFPGHWAPVSAIFYTGTQFPSRYRGGMFIAFHGSWNRAPEQQAGFKVSFVPTRDGAPSTEYETFADGFRDVDRSREGTAHRPMGLAQGPDGALYITDDRAGRIWKVRYTGSGVR